MAVFYWSGLNCRYSPILLSLFRLSVVTSVTGVRSATVTALNAQSGGTSYFMHGFLLHKSKFVNGGDMRTCVRFQ